jgi:pimeloyl-ACP methyl ester carboxylesterase
VTRVATSRHPVPSAYQRSGSGTPLVLIHGLTACRQVWQPVLPLLAERHDVVALTLPGHHGGPALPAGTPATVRALVDGVIEELDGLGIGRAHIAGNSLGGRIALELAKRDRALSVVAVAPAAWWPSDRALRRVTRSLRAGVAAARCIAPVADLAVAWPVLRRALGSRTMRFPQRCSPADIADILRAVRGCTVAKEILRSAPSEGPVRDLDRISCPVRLAWPSDDRVLPFATFGAGLAERTPGASLVMLPQTGHVPMWDDPDLVARTILEVTERADHPAASSPTSR